MLFHPIDAAQFRQALGRFASGITVVSIDVEGRVQGMTASAFVSVSMEPPLVLVSVGKSARMHDPLSRAPRYAINVLADAQAALSNHFAGRPGDVEPPTFTHHHGAPTLEGALANLVCSAHQAIDAGDHTLFLGRVEWVRYGEEAPLLYYRGKYGSFAAS